MEALTRQWTEETQEAVMKIFRARGQLRLSAFFLYFPLSFFSGIKYTRPPGRDRPRAGYRPWPSEPVRPGRSGGQANG